jgi:2-hydroxychromene-2-carboxylate isomerase
MNNMWNNVTKLLFVGTLSSYFYKKYYLAPHGEYWRIALYYITKVLFKYRLLETISRKLAKPNLTNSNVPKIEFYPSITDPHTYLLFQSLQKTMEQFSCETQIFVVSPRRARNALSKMSKMSTFEAFQNKSKKESDDNSNQFYQQPTEWGIADGHTASAGMQYDWAVKDAILSAEMFKLKPYHPPLCSKEKRVQLEMIADFALFSIVHSFNRGATPVLSSSETIVFCQQALEIADMLSNGNEQGLLSIACSNKTWNDDNDDAVTKLIVANHQHLEKKGHYLPGVLYMPHEFYWSTSRLNYLEERLFDLGYLKNKKDIKSKKNYAFHWRNQYQLNCHNDVVYPNVYVPGHLSPLSPRIDRKHQDNTLIMWYSFRSPYSQIAVARFYALARYYQVKCIVFPVLPMVMRQKPLAVPRKKSSYIIMDCSREGHRVGYPGIAMSDPVGPGTLRAFAIWYGIIYPLNDPNVEESFLRSFSRGVWSEGIDFATDSGARIIVENAGLNWENCAKFLSPCGGLGDRTSWEKEELKAREVEMVGKRGLWGVPSFAFNDISVWGQDRMKVMEIAIEKVNGVNNNNVTMSSRNSKM